LGFASQQVVDPKTGASTVTSYNNDETDKGYGYAQAFHPTTVVTRVGDNVMRVSTTTTQYDVSVQLGGRTAIARPQQMDTTVDEANAKGEVTPLSEVKETFDYDAYDNLKTRDTSWWSSGDGSVHVRGFPSS